MTDNLALKAENLAENAYLKLFHRVAMPILGVTVMMILNANTTHLEKIDNKLDGMAVSISTNSTSIAREGERGSSFEHRLDRLESWRDQFNSFKSGNALLGTPLAAKPESIIYDMSFFPEASP